jgi:glycosyltransferase involved in cell wall biosynthesis
VLWHHDLAWTSERYQAELHAGWPWDLLRRSWADSHVVVSEARRGELAALLGLPLAQIAVVPNGIDAGSLLALSPETVGLVDQLGLADAAPLLLLPARLTRRKNVELALSALGVLRRSLPGAQLMVTGPVGPHNPANQVYLEHLLELRDRLGLRGAAHLLAEVLPEPLGDRAVADLFRLADALVLPSFEEGFGIPVREAALARRPVFAADIPSLRELGGEDVSWFDPHGSPEVLAEIIARRLGDDPVYRLVVRVRGAYTWPRIYRDRIAPVLGL